MKWQKKIITLGLLTLLPVVQLSSSTFEEFINTYKSKADETTEAPEARAQFLNFLHACTRGLRAFLLKTPQERKDKGLISNSATAPADEEKTALSDQEIIERSAFLETLMLDLCSNWHLPQPESPAERELHA